MRPITNILLVLALICYVFLPFYVLSLYGTVSGLQYTAGTISQAISLGSVVKALLPFIAVFGAIGFNCLKSRWWVLLSIAFIILGIWFFKDTGSMHDVMLRHEPDVTPDNDLGEGFSIIGLGIGYKLSYVLTALSLVSAIVSMLPFKFNETIERAVDDAYEDGRRHVRKEFNRLESNLHKPHRTAKHDVTQSAATPHDNNEPPAAPIEEDKEDPARFMPKE